MILEPGLMALKGLHLTANVLGWICEFVISIPQSATVVFRCTIC